jgi:DNA-binding MarR family transcriptional regulator/GNAT superfamily N-acetyltransferase
MNSLLDRRVELVRRFNRFYTMRIGVLNEKFLRSPYSLAEGRVLFELYRSPNSTATAIAKRLAIDPGYLSRTLRGFQNRGLVKRNVSQSDARQALLKLTPRGTKAIAILNTRARNEVLAMLRSLSAAGQSQLVNAMQIIEKALASAVDSTTNKVPYVIRPHQPGDLGWIVHRHGVLYAQEYGYDERFEALAAEIVAKFVLHFNPAKERCWIAEKDGAIVASVLLVEKSAWVAKLRLLLVEPEARGLGIGARLVGECVRFARQVGYRKITLWTQSDLDAAQHIYRKAGFRRIARHRHYSFGRHLVAETWELKL